MLLLLDGELNLDFPNLSAPLLAGAVIASSVWLLLFAAYAFVSRPRKVEPNPPTQDLGPEPPAFVNLLTNGCRLTPEAPPATLLDLASRRYLDIEEYGDQETICRLHQETPEGLLPFEKQIYEHLASVAADRIVPARALTTGSKSRAAAWFKSFRSQVLAEARARGLVQNRWNRPMWATLRLAALVASGFIVALATQAGSFEAGLAFVVLVAAGVETLLQKIFGDQQLTAEGRKAAAHWLGVKAYLSENSDFADMPAGAVKLWDRYMSSAAALGLARAALRTLHMGAEDDHEAWSSYGGHWRVVKVNYPRTRLVWGRHPALALLIGAGITAAGAGLVWVMLQVHSAAGDNAGDEFAHWARIVSEVGFAVAALLIVWGIRTVLLSASDAFTSVTSEGVIIRLRDYKRGEDGHYYFAALDDGTRDRVKAWLVTYALYSRLGEGQKVRATFTPRLGHVVGVESLSPTPDAPEEPAAGAPAKAPALAANLVAGLMAAGAPQGPELPDPASLVLEEDAASALGYPVLAARAIVNQRTPLGNVRGCQYDAASDSRSSLAVFVASGSVGALLNRAGANPGNPVSGIGDKAFVRGRSIVVEAGKFLLMISMPSDDHGDAAGTLTELASKAVSRLPQAVSSVS